MDEVSVACSAPPSTRTIVTDEAICTKAAVVLLCDEEPISEAFLGVPGHHRLGGAGGVREEVVV